MPISALAFALIFIVGIGAALITDAAYGIFLYVFEYFLHPPGRWWGQALPDLRYAFTIGAVTFFAYLIRAKKYSDNKLFQIPQSKWLIMFALLMLLTSKVAVNPIEHEKFLIIFVKYVLLYFLIVKTIDTPDKFEKLMLFFLLGQFYLGWIGYELGRDIGGRLEKLGGADSQDANSAAAVMIVAIPIILNYLISGKQWQKICALPALVFILNAIILVNSRGAFIALVISITYYFFFALKSPSFPKFNKAQVIMGVILGTAFFIYLSDALFIERMESIFAPVDEEARGYTGRERIGFWMKSFDMVRDYPLGTGVMGYDFLSRLYLDPADLNPNTGTRAVHSLYFQVLAEYGYHGFLIFIFLLISCYRNSWKLRRELKKSRMYEPYYMAIALEAGFLAVLVAGVFISTLYMEINYWMAAFFAAFSNTYNKEMKKGERAIEVIEQPAWRADNYTRRRIAG